MWQQNARELIPFSAHVVRCLERAGAVVIGKANMDEFAMGSSTEYSAFGPTLNPWDLSKVPEEALVEARHRLPQVMLP